MKKWIFAVVLVGLLGWVVYDYVIKDDDGIKQQSIKEQQKQLDQEKEKKSSSDKKNEKSEIGLGYDQFAPDFELMTLDGEKMKLSEHRGKPVMINFWATWCPPCQAEMPDMERFYKDTGMTIFSVNLTDSEPSEQQVQDFVKDYELTFPILLDKKVEVAKIYGIQPIPTTYILDKDGRIHHKMSGPMNYDFMMEKFNEVK